VKTEAMITCAGRPFGVLKLQVRLASLLCMIALVSSATDADIARSARNSVVFLEVSVTEDTGKVTTETGTGFIVAAAGYVLSAAHLMSSPGARITGSIGSRFGERLPLTIIPVSGPLDAVLLQLPDSKGPYQPVMLKDPSSLSIADHLISIGFPLNEDLSVSGGMLGNKGGPAGSWQISIPLNYGNSGSPIIDSSGGVVGMAKGGVYPAQNINYMLPLNLLAPLLISAGKQWPPFESRTGSAPLLPSGPDTLTPAHSSTTANCHEVVQMAAGLPPKYTKVIVCE
jgi:S1-C subfamily serine protease